MSKLQTPFMYEDKLAGLAESFPLKLKDEASQVISLPVCDIQPADSQPPAVGRFLSATQSGGLLCKNRAGLTNRESFLLEWATDEWDVRLVEFSQVVYRVGLQIKVVHPLRMIVWCDSERFFLKGYFPVGFYDLPFRGTKIYFYAYYFGGECVIEVHGFY